MSIERFKALRQEKISNNKALWDEISKYVGIQVNLQTVNYGTRSNTANAVLDSSVVDPTAAISVNQAGDFLVGVLWGSGENALTLTPSHYVLDEEGDKESLGPFYARATQRVLYHMNHEKSGFLTSLRPYAYDQSAFGTSAISVFLNEKYIKGDADNALVFNAFGVDTLSFDEGINGIPDVVYVEFNWTANRVVSEFETYPESVRKALDRNDTMARFHVVLGVYPNPTFERGLFGKNGMPYKGEWFLPDEKSKGAVLRTDYYPERPISVARAVKIRGEKYGRAAGTMLLSAIKGVNFMVGTTFDIIDKMAEPPLGVFGSSIMGDNVLNTSARSMTTFNPFAMNAAGKGDPVFKLFDAQDPTGIINFLVPFLNEKIALGFKLDALLDVGDNRDITATESLQRFSVRGKTMSGILTQQKTEIMLPTIRAVIALLNQVGEFGVNREVDPERAAFLEQNDMADRIIPDSVRAVMERGLPWYEIKMNTDLEKMISTEKVDNLLRILQIVGAVAQINPQIISAIDFYQLVKEAKDSVDSNTAILLSREMFMEAIQQQAQQAQVMQAVEMEERLAQAQRARSFGKKAEKEAGAV